MVLTGEALNAHRRLRYKNDLEFRLKDNARNRNENRTPDEIEKKNAKQRDYYKSNIGIEVRQISSWKNAGIVYDDYVFLYMIYDWWTSCDKCYKYVTNKNKGKNLINVDHNHKTGEIRGLVCTSCNQKQAYNDKIKELVFNRLKLATYISKRERLFSNQAEKIL